MIPRLERGPTSARAQHGRSARRCRAPFVDPQKGLFFGVTPPKRIGEWNDRVRRKEATLTPPANTRASGRARAVAFFQQRHHPYVINWDSIACDSRDFLVMGDPFNDYNEEVGRFLSRAGFTPID